jgi:hypothetical protein
MRKQSNSEFDATSDQKSPGARDISMLNMRLQKLAADRISGRRYISVL